MASVLVAEELRPDHAWRVDAEVDGLVGAIAIVERNGPEAIVRAIVTMPGFERLGLAGELLEACAELARRHGATVLSASCAPGDRATKALFEEAGLRTVELRLARSLA